MPRDFLANERTAVPLPHGVLAASLVSVLSTASLLSATVLDDAELARALAVDLPTTATALDGLPSALGYPEMAGSAAAAGPIAPLTGTAPDPKEPIRERIRSIMMAADDRGEGTPPSPAAIDDALRFVDLLPAESPVPHVSVADDGEINFFRRRQGLFVDIGFFGDGQIHYYARVEARGIDVDGSEPFSGRSLPRDLVIPVTTD